MPKRDDEKQISVRFDEDLYEYILQRAKKNRRSFNAELNIIVQEALQWPEINSEKGGMNRA